jgi:hypothetical protein
VINRAVSGLGIENTEIEHILAQCYRMAIARAQEAKRLKGRNRTDNEWIVSSANKDVEIEKTSTNGKTGP